MGKRRINFNLGIEYGTTIDQIKNCVKELREMLVDHEAIHKDTIFVNFDSFRDSSLDIFIYCFTSTTNWGEFLQAKEDVNLKILEILERNNVKPAFPSRSIYVRREEESSGKIAKKELKDQTAEEQVRIAN